MFAGFFICRGLKPRIFFDWDVRGRATSGRGNLFFMALPPKKRWRCHTIVEEMKAADIFSESQKNCGEISFEQ